MSSLFEDKNGEIELSFNEAGPHHDTLTIRMDPVAKKVTLELDEFVTLSFDVPSIGVARKLMEAFGLFYENMLEVGVGGTNLA